jgi:hypothetical protein
VVGTAQEGQRLTADSGNWTGTQPISIAFQWLRCARDGDSCASIIGAAGRTYQVSSADLGRTIRLRVTATNSVGSTTATSAATAVVTRRTAPVNTARPNVVGTAQEGQTLTADSGNWSGTQPISFAFQWLRCASNGDSCASVIGATGRTYRVSSADLGRTIRLRVTARNSVGSTTATSAATAVVSPAGSAPVSSARPTISGTPKEGQTLTANAGFTGTQPITSTYQWQRCDRNGGSCSNIVGATGQTYRLTSADVNRTLRVVVTAKNAAGSTAATSVPTAVVTPAAPPGPAGQIRLPSGRISIPASSVAPPARLIIDGVSFSPNPVRSRRTPIRARFRVSDTRGFVVRDALVFVRSTPLVTETSPEGRTDQAGFVTFQLQARASFPLRTGYNVQFFIRARKAGDNVLAGVSTRRLVQVRTANP